MSGPSGAVQGLNRIGGCRYLDELAADLQVDEFPPELRSLGRTLVGWRDHTVAWHRARASNGPAEAINNLVKRV